VKNKVQVTAGKLIILASIIKSFKASSLHKCQSAAPEAAKSEIAVSKA